jgi:hypothetical protein
VNPAVLSAFAHKKGKGFNLLIGGKRYAAFPPKSKTAQPEQPAHRPVMTCYRLVS